jgi:hypothetical protein
MVDLPDPHHADKHDRTAVQRRDNVGLPGRAVLLSGRDLGHLPGWGRLNVTYTTPRLPPPETCRNGANMLVLWNGRTATRWLTPLTRLPEG